MSYIGNALTKLVNLLGDLNFIGTGQRIKGDFSNATVANRVMFQTSTPTSNTTVTVIPASGANQASLQLRSDPTFAAGAIFRLTGNSSLGSCGLFAEGDYLPMTFSTGGAERMRIDTTGIIVMAALPALNYANDGAAAAGGVPIGGLYNTTGTVKVRLV